MYVLLHKTLYRSMIAGLVTVAVAGLGVCFITAAKHAELEAVKQESSLRGDLLKKANDDLAAMSRQVSSCWKQKPAQALVDKFDTPEWADK